MYTYMYYKSTSITLIKINELLRIRILHRRTLRNVPLDNKSKSVNVIHSVLQFFIVLFVIRNSVLKKKRESIKIQ